MPVDKFLNDTAYYTCGVKRGKFVGIVTASARQSFVGKTATLVMGSNDEGHFKQVLNGIGTTLLVLVILFILIEIIGGFFRGTGIASPEQNVSRLSLSSRNLVVHRHTNPTQTEFTRIRLDLFDRRCTRRTAVRYDYDYGCWRCLSREEESDRSETYGNRIPCWCRHPMLGQDRNGMYQSLVSANRNRD